MHLDQRQTAKAVRELAEVIEQAAIGSVPWGNLTSQFSSLFPGSFSTIQNMDVINRILPFIEATGLDDSVIQSYADHYVSVNPYERYWCGHAQGQVWSTDHTLPIPAIAGTEFHDDWLAKAGEFDSAIGVRLEPTAENEVRFNLHFPNRLVEVYEKPVFDIISQLRSSLRRAITLSNQLASNQEKNTLETALLGRSNKAAFVVDIGLRLKDANARFEALVRQSAVFAYRQGKVELKDRDRNTLFGENIRQIGLQALSSVERQPLRAEHGSCVLSFHRLPGIAGLVTQLPMVLVQVTELNTKPNAVSLKGLADLFELTDSEVVFCATLLSHLDLSAAAVACNISYETARTKIKKIFQKTHTSKQAELLLLLEQFKGS